MSLRQSFLTKRYSNVFYFNHGIYTHAAENSEERETRLEKRRVADRARYAANSDRKTERHRERRAAERSEQRETRLARRRVADSARFAAISR